MTEFVGFLLLCCALVILGVLSFWQHQRLERLEKLSVPETGHVHRWSQWKEWGVTYQQRHCEDCGFNQLESQKTSKGKNL